MASSQPYLFYSDKCPNSKQVIETLKALNKSSLYKFVLVETLARNQIPAFLKKVPTLYIPETKDVIIGKDIYGFIAKPTNARKELPTKDANGASTGSSAGPIGDLLPWGFEGSGSLTESYSMWDSPQSFANQGGSMYTFLDSPITSQGGAGLPATAAPSSENTIKSKTGNNADVMARMEAMQNQRGGEFGGVTRK